ncbi:hypothetical protein NQ315_015538 [Exocentrus adspersus]|uniref:Reverse transcriptase domain-containing protein n=1 Tax=Exocentrus adspersus TaxID=1586481 RepID=A0AAV8VNV8_9CUCU|nr:hypothetical protein NQ315_015538 [Exocentrus adspersus]
MNIQSVRNKLDDVQGFVMNNNCDVLVLAETWLDEKEAFLFNLSNYKAVHSCRTTRGGGVSIYIKEGIKYVELEKSNVNDVINWVCVGIGEQKLKVSAIYKPPLYKNDDFLPRLESILTKYPRKHLMIGDININLLSDNDITGNYVALIAFNNFKIVNTIDETNATRVTNHNRSIIDHVLIDQHSNLNCSVKIKNNCLSDHKLLSVTVENDVCAKPKINHEVKLVDYKRFKELFNHKIDKANIESFQELIDLIRVCKTESEYVKVIRIRQNNVWMNKEVLDLMRQRDELYEKKMKNPGVGKSIVAGIEREINALPDFVKNEEIYCVNSMVLEGTSESEVNAIIQELKVNSAPGHDQISVLDINNLKADVVPVLKKLIDNIYVEYNNMRSSVLSNTCGVPQGSVLGPLLYSLYVLNLKNANLQARYFTFADDTVLVYTGLEGRSLNQVVSADLGVYMHWLLSNKIKINIEKTKYMLFKQKNKIVEDIDCYNICYIINIFK